MRAVRWILLAIIVLPAALGLISLPGRFCFTLVSRASPPEYAYLTIAEGRVGYSYSTNPASKPPSFPHDYDWFEWSMSKQFETAQEIIFTDYHMTDQSGSEQKSMGFQWYDYMTRGDIFYVAAERKLYRVGPAFASTARYIPAWLLCLPAFLLLCSQLRHLVKIKHEDNSRGFEPQLKND